MADIFRLLSRSTSFAKGASGGSNIHQFRPNPTTKPHRSTPDDAIPKELDFFHMGNPSTDSKKRKRGNTEKDCDVEDSDNKSDDRVDAGAVLESPDDIRKVLWEHKLKFTVLAGPRKHEEIEERKKKKKQSVLIPPLTSFSQLRSAKHGYTLSKRVYENILRQGYTAPTEVQMGTLPVLMKRDMVAEMPSGEVDLLTCAPTGSGKTLAYVVPLLDGILAGRKNGVNEKGIKAIILAPTKELAGQIVNEIKKLSVGTGVKVSLMRKGMAATSTKGENAGIHIKSDVLVSTPLLLLHAIESKEGKGEFERVRRLVLDEADVLLDELFRDQTLGIWKALRETANGNLRTSLWSATISSGTEEIARNMMLPTLDEPSNPSKPSKPKKANSSQTILRLIVGLKDTAIPTVHQTLLYAATEPGKLLALRQLFTTSLHPPALIFAQSIPRAQALHNEILYDLPTGRIAVLHASLTDTARHDVMDRFRRGDIWVLITTDLLARGVDFRGVRLVINYDIPTTVVAYIHRVGRTGRAGRDGAAVTYYTKEDIGYVKGIANVIAVAQKMAGRDDGVQKWLLDALPKTSRRERKQIKMHGVKARSVSKISTKSGYERQKADAKRGAAEASRKRKMAERDGSDDDMGDDGEEFMGIDE